MNTSPMMNVMKGVAIGMTAGVCMGIVGKNMVENSRKRQTKPLRQWSQSSTPHSICSDKIIFIINNPPTQTNRGVK